MRLTKEILRENLVSYRVKNNYTQKQLAEELALSRSTYTYYETGKTVPSIYTLRELAMLYGIRMEDFFQENPSA